MRKLVFGFPLVLAILFAGCSKDNSSNGVNAEFYYDATIDGVKYRVEIPYDNMDMNLVYGTSIYGYDEVSFESYVVNLGANGTSMVVGKGIMTEFLDATTDDFKEFLAVGPHALTLAGIQGAWIDWYDESGTVWSTKSGTADQSGSTFNIVSVEEHNGPSELKVTVQFNCNLYEGTNVKPASGTFVGVFKMH